MEDKNDNELVLEIEKSKYIIDLKDEWDNEGSIGYTIQTWEKAVNYLVKLINKTHLTKGIKISTPKIAHGPNGSIDIFWENNKFNLILNIKSDSDNISYFGETNEESKKGIFKIDSDNGELDFLFID